MFGIPYTAISSYDRFALAHEGHKCRRAVILEFFDEPVPSGKGGESGCCDVCSSDYTMTDYKDELVSIIQVAQDIPGYGEVKVNSGPFSSFLCIHTHANYWWLLWTTIVVGVWLGNSTIERLHVLIHIRLPSGSEGPKTRLL